MSRRLNCASAAAVLYGSGGAGGFAPLPMSVHPPAFVPEHLQHYQRRPVRCGKFDVSLWLEAQLHGKVERGEVRHRDNRADADASHLDKGIAEEVPQGLPAGPSRAVAGGYRHLHVDAVVALPLDVALDDALSEEDPDEEAVLELDDVELLEKEDEEDEEDCGVFKCMRKAVENDKCGRLS